MKCVIILVTTGATGIATKLLRKYLKVTTGKYSIDSLQKTAVRWNITLNTESIAVWNLKPERWRSLLVQEKYHGKKICDRRRVESVL
jgi:hypothetical protein